MAIPDGTIGLPQLSAKPSPPVAGAVILYTRSDGVLYLQDSSGTEFPFGSVDFISSLTGDVSATGPGAATATVNFVGGQSAANVANATIAYLAATSANTPSTLVLRDSSGNFSAGTITASLNGNATSAGSATTAISFTGPLLGDVTGTQGATVVSFVDGYTAAAVGASVLATQSATALNTASTLVLRDASGNFAANIITATLSGNATTATTAVNFTGALSGDVTGTQSATSIASTVVTGKLLTGLTTGTNTVILATDSILTAFEKLQAQVSGSVGSAITALTGDVTASGPGSAEAPVAAIQGTTVSGTTGTVNVVFSNAPTLTGLLSGGSASFSSTISASNLSGTNTGDVTLTNTNSIDLSFTSGQTGLQANLNLSSDAADVNNIKATVTVHSGAGAGLHVEYPYGVPVQIGTSNAPGGASSVALSDHVHAITSATVLGLLLTGYVTGTNTPILATNSLLTAFENLQAQISATSGSAITALTGDVTASGPGSAAATVVAIQGSSVSTTAPTDAQILIWNSSTSKYVPQSLNTDIAITHAGVVTIQPNVVTNSKLAQMPTDTIKGNNTGSTANAADLTITQVNALLGTVTTVGSYNGGTANANGATITSPNIFFQSASASFPGMVDTTTQTFAGNKTFSGVTSISNTSTTALIINATSFVFDATNNALGIGVTPATNTFIDAVNSTGASKTLQLTGYGTGSTVGTRGRFARGTSGSPTAAQTGDIINFWSARGYGASQFAAASTGAINAVAGENFTNTSNFTYLAFQTTPTGSVTSAEAMRVASTGVTLGPQSGSTAIHQVNGGWYRTNKTIAANYVVDTTTTDDIILCNQSTAITVTLPAPTNGRAVLIKDISGTTETNTITVLRHASEKIEGLAASRILYTNFGTWTFVADGTNWWMV